MLTSEQINLRLYEIESPDGGVQEYVVPGLSVHGKVLPYIGWYWRDVDFDQPIRLGDCGSFIGFMESNKWGYPEWRVSEEQNAEIKRLSLDLAEAPTEPKLQAFFAYIQTCTPAGYGGFDKAMEAENEVMRRVLAGERYDDVVKEVRGGGQGEG